MKKILLTSAICMTMTSGAFCATKCVKLDGTTACTISAPQNQLDWSGDCNGTSIKGIATCGTSTNSPTIGTTTDILVTQNADTMYDNNNCWCKMISPAVSKWVYAGNGGSTTEACLTDCTTHCANQLQNVRNSTFRNAMFSNLSD